MNWFFRPSNLILASIVLAFGSAGIVFWPRAPENRALPLPVPEGDEEVVWLYAATNAAPWERFVSAAGVVAQRLKGTPGNPELTVDEHNAFPPQTTAVPELAVSVKGRKKRLLFRWYKLTSDLKTQEWVQALLQRQPAPLAILGGSSSDLAIELAKQLRAGAEQHRDPDTLPLLFLTSATADEAGPTEGLLTRLYPGRTFRFCFTNRQMAEAVTDFIWSRDDLRPEADPLYSTYWKDDRYSIDLNQRFVDALSARALQTWVRDWAWLGSLAAGGSSPFDLAGVGESQFLLMTHIGVWSPSSVGLYTRPNKWEADNARDLIEARVNKENRRQKRPLLVIPATSQPTRRFLHALVRTAPREAGRFVIAAGDGMAFNTIYRDREVAWPILELPFPLVFFCHRNPVDREAGFEPETSVNSAFDSEPAEKSAGTEDLLLNVDIVESLVQARLVARSDPQASPAAEFRKQFAQAGWDEEEARIRLDGNHEPLFDSDGNRRSGTGEHVVYLRPLLRGEEVLPRSIIEVWAWYPQNPAAERWSRRELLPVEYEGIVSQESDQ